MMRKNNEIENEIGNYLHRTEGHSTPKDYIELYATLNGPEIKRYFDMTKIFQENTAL